MRTPNGALKEKSKNLFSGNYNLTTTINDNNINKNSNTTTSLLKVFITRNGFQNDAGDSMEILNSKLNRVHISIINEF